jgi:hypothetical protein
MTFVSKNFCSEIVNIHSNFEVIAVRIFFSFKFTICNLYLRGSENIQYTEIASLIDQLESPFMILGDMNGRNFIWGLDRTDTRGRIIEEIINNYSLCLLNQGQNTHFSHAYKSFSAID